MRKTVRSRGSATAAGEQNCGFLPGGCLNTCGVAVTRPRVRRCPLPIHTDVAETGSVAGTRGWEIGCSQQSKQTPEIVVAETTDDAIPGWCDSRPETPGPDNLRVIAHEPRVLCWSSG